MKLEQEIQTKPQICRKKKITKNRAEIHKIESKKDNRKGQCN